MYGTNYFRQRKSLTGSEEKVPLRWMAPESIENSIYNEATDVVSCMHVPTNCLCIKSLAVHLHCVCNIKGTEGLSVIINE